jgi:hypothetical protein
MGLSSGPEKREGYTLGPGTSCIAARKAMPPLRCFSKFAVALERFALAIVRP